MKLCRIYIIALLALLFLGERALAEFRVWTDSDGDKVEAEYVRTVIDTVVLKLKSGKQLEVKLSKLSEQDRQHAMLLNPPGVNIKVSTQVDDKTVGYLGDVEYSYRLKYEIVKPAVTVKKEGATPYTAPLQLEMAVLGEVEETDRYIIIDRTQSAFVFTSKNKNQFSYRGEPIDLQLITGSLKVGIKYHGYVVVVRDSLGRILGRKGSRESLEEAADKILKFDTNAQFNENLEPVKPRKANGDAGYNLPGRLF